ncbi:MAG: DUF1232 domain-containing protein [Bacteroidetes bacterium]|nr:DUF1232 domain-containing protein [Fibrella sp.]
MANGSLISRVLGSLFFRRANLKAVRYARNSKSLFSLIQDVLSKSGGLSGSNFKLVREELSLLTRMVRAYATGDYRDIPWKTLVSIIAVLIYFVSPIDFIPDFLPVVGITDDIALVLWLVSSIRKDLEKFRHWEGPRVQVTDASVRPKRESVGQS